MCETYSIEDLATFTGLTDRTLRSYLKEGRLTGRKEDGAWRFTPEDLEKLFQDEGTRQAVRANRNAIVYDFMLNGGGRTPAAPFGTSPWNGMGRRPCASGCWSG